MCYFENDEDRPHGKRFERPHSRKRWSCVRTLEHLSGPLQFQSILLYFISDILVSRFSLAVIPQSFICLCCVTAANPHIHTPN